MSTIRLTRGIRVGDRYRLEQELGRGTGGITWEAVDERLDRSVALRLFAEGSDRKSIIKRAGLAASLTHPRVVRVFDTGEEGSRFFTVSELVAESLQTVKLPLPPDTSVQIAVDIAEALQYAHERGVVHGNLHEGNVLLSEGGAKVGDFALSLNSSGAKAADDLRAFGALMQRVSRVPDHVASTGFVRVLQGLVSGTYGSAADALVDLRALRPAPVRTSASTPRRGWLVVVVALLLGLAAFGAMRLGGHGEGQELIPNGHIDGSPLKPQKAIDLDPYTTDPTKSENRGTVGNAIDDSEQTAWFTERYSASPNFNGKKPGVGVMLAFDRGVEAGKARVLWAAQGCSFQLLYSDDPAAPVNQWSTAATIAKSPVAAAFEFDAKTAPYWLVWITQLVPDAGGYRCGVREVQLFSP